MTSPPAAAGHAGASIQQTGFFGHPRGLATLFFAELWERFSYYGMRALLILFMTAPVASGGLGFDVAKAGAIYGLYTALAYMTGLPGGWIADRFLGQRRSVLIGGIVITLGHISLAMHGLSSFYLGLFLIIMGTGLLKPNMSSMVGALYSEEDKRRDAGFSIYYMGINIGAMIAPLACGYLAQSEGFKGLLAGWGFNPDNSWHWGFGAAAVGMALGLVQYVMGDRYLGEAGLHPSPIEDPVEHARQKRMIVLTVGVLAVLGVALLAANASGVVEITVDRFTKAAGTLVLVTPLVYFAYLFLRVELSPVERKRLAVIAILFSFTSLFFAAFEQAGSTLNLFADRFTRNEILGWQYPSSWFQSVNSVFIIALAPVFAWLWVWLGKREPSSPAKFAIGLLSVGVGFLVIAVAAYLSGPDGKLVSPMWLIMVYLIHTIGELCLSPVGLSLVTKLAPLRLAGQMMGVWFMSISVGNFMGGQVAGLFESFPLPQLFGSVFLTTTAATVVLALLIKPIRRLMSGIH